jgi:multimeric flavodoxin WrbA
MNNTVLIVNGSPRGNGNSSFLVTKVVEGLRDGNIDVDVEVLNLRSLRIEPCKACNACRAKTRKQPYCIIKDDMEQIYEKLVNCRALVLVSPIYWFTITAQMKLFMDRMYGLAIEETHSLVNKPIGIVLVYGDADPYSSGAVNAIRTLEDSFKYTGSRIAGIVYGTANDKGDAEKNTELCTKVVDLGRTLLN